MIIPYENSVYFRFLMKFRVFTVLIFTVLLNDNDGKQTTDENEIAHTQPTILQNF